VEYDSSREPARVGASTGVLDDLPVRMKNKVRRVIYGAVGDPRDAVLEARSQDKRIRHVRPFGARDKFSRGVMALVAQAGDEVKARIAADKELAGWYWSALRKGVQLGDSTSLQLYTKILKLVDEEKQVVVMVLQQLGMSNMEELERLVETHRDHAGVTPEQRASICMDFVEMWVNANPGDRGAFVRRLGGEMVQRSDSMAEVLGGKGRV